MRDKYDISPATIKDEIDELIFQNTKNAHLGRKKFTLELIGSPGIGKTQAVEEYPYRNLSEVNSKIASKIISKTFNFNYRKPSNGNTIERQSIEKLETTQHSKEVKKKVLDAIHKKPLIAVKIVRQSDIIVPEDISGLPTSESDLRQLEILHNITKDSEYGEYKEYAVKKIKSLLSNVFKKEGVNASELRNTSSFDFTEWEKEVHDLSKDFDHVVLVLDDITRSAANNTSILNVLMPIFQEAYIGQRQLPPNSSVIVTSNEKESDDGGINYVVDFDQAQKDRLRTKKILFKYQDWEDWAKLNDVHESVILFTKQKQHYFTKGIVTPRRISELGQSITNKFGNNDISMDNPEQNENLIKTIYFHLGDSKHANYLTVITDFITFLKEITNEVNNFIKAFRDMGWNKDNKLAIQNMRNSGETIKLMIIVHKISDLMSKQILSKAESKAIVEIFNDNDALPFNLRFNIFNVACQWTKEHEKYVDNNLSKEEETIMHQMNRILEITSEEVGKMKDLQSIRAKQYKDTLK
jgi:hypothetical protein